MIHPLHPCSRHGLIDQPDCSDFDAFRGFLMLLDAFRGFLCVFEGAEREMEGDRRPVGKIRHDNNVDLCHKLHV